MKTTTSVRFRTALGLVCESLVACSLIDPLPPLEHASHGEGGAAGASGSSGLEDAVVGAAAAPVADAAAGAAARSAASGGTAGATTEGALAEGGTSEGVAGAGDTATPGACQPKDERSCVEAGLLGPCADGTQVCRVDGTWGPCSVLPKTKDTCEAGNDANCNGTPNEGCICTVGSTRPCEDALGNCAEGVETCLDDGSGWSACSVETESADSCEPGDDADCDGQPNQGCPCVESDEQPCGPESEIGICRSGVSTCTANGTWGTCEGAVNPKARDCRSSEDNDCDGSPDNTVDDVCKCIVGEKQECQTHTQDGIGVCKAGSQTCVALQYGATSDWSVCSGSVGPKARNCASALDNDCDGIPDKGTGGPEFMKLPEGYCVDSTEVTRAQYEAWLDSGPSTSGQLGACSWNDSFEPPESCMSDSLVCQTGCANHPQVCVDWCDAYAYCKAMGKRLCGRLGGGANAYTHYASLEFSQWFNACTSHGANDYAGSGACSSYKDTGTGSTLAVGTLTTCQSSVLGYEGVFDLIGNVEEWEDSCENTLGESDNCRCRGGWFYDDARSEGLRCSSERYHPRNRPHASTGFRCCSL